MKKHGKKLSKRERDKIRYGMLAPQPIPPGSMLDDLIKDVLASRDSSSPTDVVPPVVE